MHIHPVRYELNRSQSAYNVTDDSPMKDKLPYVHFIFVDSLTVFHKGVP